MFPLTLRQSKGSPLTHQGMDNNFKHVLFPPFLHIQDQKPQGTSGGTFTAGAWRTRDLNTVLTNTIIGASLSNNQITLPAGKYYVEVSAPAFSNVIDIGRLQTILVNSDGVVLLLGRNSYVRQMAGTTEAQVDSHVIGCFVLDSETTVALQHQCQTTNSNDWAMGISANFTTEVYSDIRIWRIGDYEE